MRRFILAYVDQWPLWVCRKHIFEPPDRPGEVWVEIDDIPDLKGKLDALAHLLYELRRLEWTLEHDGITGWISANRKGNEAMRRLVLAIGAKKFQEDEEFEYFYKLPNHPPLPKRVVEFFRQAGPDWRERVSHATA
jgi:hypothetical protein